MKHVLIAGKDSYIGNKLTAWLDKARYRCHTLDMRTDAWKQHDFSAYDTVVMVAGIAHQRETAENRALYDLVNHRLAVETASAAKAAGVRQFVFFSSMSVYGLEVGRITADTRVKPVSAYGQSKLDAEHALKTLEDEQFHVAVLRPPMIYGLQGQLSAAGKADPQSARAAAGGKRAQHAVYRYALRVYGQPLAKRRRRPLFSAEQLLCIHRCSGTRHRKSAWISAAAASRAWMAAAKCRPAGRDHRQSVWHADLRSDHE